MKRTLIIFGAIAAIVLLVSCATTVPAVNSNPVMSTLQKEEEKLKTSSLATILTKGLIGDLIALIQALIALIQVIMRLIGNLQIIKSLIDKISNWPARITQLIQKIMDIINSIFPHIWDKKIGG